jgi:hypothetical protein
MMATLQSDEYNRVQSCKELQVTAIINPMRCREAAAGCTRAEHERRVAQCTYPAIDSAAVQGSSLARRI